MQAMPTRKPVVPLTRISHGAGVLGLLLLGLLGDYFTGPEIPAAAFYLAAVIWASWRLGWAEGGLSAIAATLLNALCDAHSHVQPHPGFSLVANELLGLMTLTCAVALTATARRHQEVQAAQRLQLDTYHQRIEADLLTAQRLQRLLMGTLPDVPGWDLGWFLQASRIVGGDVCSVSLGPDGRLAVLVADVCGKGSSAALTGAVLLGLIDDAPECFTSPAGTLAYLNARLTDRLPNNLFITAFYALAEPGTGRVLYSSAGHEPPLLFRRSGSEELPEGGPALGLIDGAEYGEAEVRMEPGDLLLAYTDGILDYKAPGGSRRDAAELSALTSGLTAHDCTDVVEGLVRAVTACSEDVPDDITLLALRRLS